MKACLKEMNINRLQDADGGEVWVSYIEKKLKQGCFISLGELSVWLACQVNKTIHPPVAMRLEGELREAASKNKLNILRDNIKINKSLFNFLKGYYGVILPNYLSEEDKTKLLDAKAALEAIEAAPKPNWRYWTQLFTVGIEDAVYLTLDVNPDLWSKFLNLSYAGNIPDEIIQPKAIEAYELLKLHRERVEICASHRKSIGGDLPSHGNTKQIYLAQFGAWAKAKGWELPIDHPIELESKNNPIIEIEPKQVKQEEETTDKDSKYVKWQEAVNNEYAKNNRLSHSAICVRLAKSLNTSPGTLRRRTQNPRRLKPY